jgi:hypothetical protein
MRDREHYYDLIARWLDACPLPLMGAIRSAQREFAARAVRGVLQLLRGVSEDGSGPARLAVHVDERIALDAVVPLPLDGEVGVGPHVQHRQKIIAA